jgi:hypothetical protein
LKSKIGYEKRRLLRQLDAAKMRLLKALLSGFAVLLTPLTAHVRITPNVFAALGQLS